MHLTAQAVKLLHRDDEPETAEMASTKAAVKLADLVLADLAAREAEERERALLIDDEWLIAIGFTKQFNEGVTFCIISSKSHEVEVIRGCVYLAPKNGTFIRIGTALTTTRGMILDLLAGLKIPTKGGAE